MRKKIEKLTTWGTANPKRVFIGMVILIALSLLHFTYRAIRPVEVTKMDGIEFKEPPTGFSGFPLGELMDEAATIKDTYRLKKSIDSLIKKEHLTTQDSITLMHQLEEVKALTQKKIK